jgi:hypothetical protein
MRDVEPLNVTLAARPKHGFGLRDPDSVNGCKTQFRRTEVVIPAVSNGWRENRTALLFLKLVVIAPGNAARRTGWKNFGGEATAVILL